MTRKPRERRLPPRPSLHGQALSSPWRSTFPERRRGASRHGIVSRLMRLARGMQPSLPLQPCQIEPMSGPRGELFQILKLCPAVSVPEGMHVIQIADDLPGPRREILARQPLEIPRRDDPPMHVGHAGLDIGPELKLVSVLRDSSVRILPAQS